MEGWPYSAYNRLPHSAQPEFQQYSNSAGSSASSAAAQSAQQILLHHQLRQAQANAGQVHQYLPPSLMAAASASKSSQNNQVTPPQTPQGWKSNSNGLVIIPEPQKATTNRSYSNSSSSELLVETVTVENSRTMRHATELKSSQPVFPGQPPPLARFENKHQQSYSQPPPRQSSQPPQRSSSNINRTAFPGQQPPISVGYFFYISPFSFSITCPVL